MFVSDTDGSGFLEREREREARKEKRLFHEKSESQKCLIIKGKKNACKFIKYKMNSKKIEYN